MSVIRVEPGPCWALRHPDFEYEAHESDEASAILAAADLLGDTGDVVTVVKADGSILPAVPAEVPGVQPGPDQLALLDGPGAA